MNKTCITAALLAAAASSHAATVWDEATSGDLSDDRLAPTAVAMTVGHNVVLGTTGDAGAGVDRDYFRFTVPTGATLQTITLAPHPVTSFFALQAGPQITVTASGGGDGVQALLGFNHLGHNDDPQDILPDLATTPTALPIKAGTYSMWVQETGGSVRYGLDFVITSSVPEPTTALMLGLGLAGLACRRFVLQRR